MATLRKDRFRSWSFAINGVGYLIDWEEERPYTLQADDLVFERQELTQQLEENKLDNEWWGANRSWHDGAGQKRLHMPDISTPYGFDSSKGVDITEPGELTLLPQARSALALTNNNQFLVVTDKFVYVADVQPNLQRFSKLDASDAEAVSTATESGNEVEDLATDGEIVYIALAGDGTHRITEDSDTQIASMDSTTNWTAGTNVTLATDSNDKQEGSASLKATASGATDPIATRSFGVAQDFSGADTFTVWVKVVPDGGDGVFSGWQLRFRTDASNYFETSSTVMDTDGSWQKFTYSRTQDFSSTGTPSWSNINSVVFDGNISGEEVRLDDLREQGGTASSHWSDWDARAVGWAKDRVFAAGIKSGTQWRFFEAASGTNSEEIFILPDGWEVVEGTITHLGGFVYFAAQRERQGVVYAYDGQNAPFVALPLQNGEVPTMLQPFAGAGMLIGSRRLISQSESGGVGRLYRAFPISSGHLTAEKITDIGEDDGSDHSPKTGFEWGDFAYFGWSHADNDSAGIGVYLPEFGSYARHINSLDTDTASDIVRSSGVFKGRRLFTIDGHGVYVEQSTFVASGSITSSLIDLNVSADKMWLSQEAAFDLNGGRFVTQEYSTDGGDTFTGGTTADSGSRLHVDRNISARSIQYKVTIEPSSDQLNSPILREAGIGGYPTRLPGAEHAMVVMAYPRHTSKAGDIRHDPDEAWTILSNLRGLRDSATAVEFQDPAWHIHETTRTVRVSGVRILDGFNRDDRRQEPGGRILLRVKETT